jgi:hypothetical protein
MAEPMILLEVCGAGVLYVGAGGYRWCGTPLGRTGELFKAACRHEHVTLLPLCARHAALPSEHRCLACHEHPDDPHVCPLLLTVATARDVRALVD